MVSPHPVKYIGKCIAAFLSWPVHTVRSHGYLQIHRQMQDPSDHRIDHQHDIFIALTYLCQQCFFFCRDKVISFFVKTVFVFSAIRAITNTAVSAPSVFAVSTSMPFPHGIKNGVAEYASKNAFGLSIVSVFFRISAFQFFSRLVVDLHIGIQPAFCSYFVSGIFHPLCDGHIITLIDIPEPVPPLMVLTAPAPYSAIFPPFFAGRKCSSFFKEQILLLPLSVQGRGCRSHAVLLRWMLFH